jgi:hypothetical protein
MSAMSRFEIEFAEDLACYFRTETNTIAKTPEFMIELVHRYPDDLLIKKSRAEFVCDNYDYGELEAQRLRELLTLAYKAESAYLSAFQNSGA